VLGVLLLDARARTSDARAAQLDVRRTCRGDARRRRRDVLFGKGRGALRDGEVLLVVRDVDQPPRDLR
jgi:hypothetical protein